MFSVAELAKLLQLSYQGEGTRVLTRVSSWDEADASSLDFPGWEESLPITHPVGRLRDRFTPVGRSLAGLPFFLQNPKLDFARAANRLLPRPRGTGVHHPSATVEAGATLGTRG